VSNSALSLAKVLFCASAFYPISSYAFKEESSSILDLSLEQLLQVKVSTATKDDQEISDAPSIINVITASELESLGVRTLGEALGISPGTTLIEQQKGDQILVIRGLALRDGVLVLVDGSPVNDAFDGNSVFFNRSIADIERIEILRGPSSALYGSYAVSGVVQIFTKRWQESEEKLKLSISGGSFSSNSFSVNYAPNIEKIFPDLKTAMSFSYSDEKGDSYFIQQDALFTPEQGTFLPPFSNPTLTPTERNKPVETFNGHLALDFKKLKLTFVHSQELTNPLVSHVGVVTDINKTIKETTQDLLTINYSSEVSEKLDFEINGFYALNESKLFGQSEPPQIHGDEDQDGLNENFFSGIIENFHHQTRSIGLDASLKYRLGNNHKILIGLSHSTAKLVEAQKYANVSLAGRGPTELFPVQDISFEFIDEGIERKETAVYIQDNWQLHESVNVTIGARFGDYNDFGATSDPRVGINYRISPKTYTKILYGEAFKAPAFAQLFDGTPTLSANRQRGNANLEPTEINSLEWQLGYDFSNVIKGNATLFHNETENEIFFDPTPGIEQWQNAGERTSKGIELELKGRFVSLFDLSTLNYSYQRTSGVDSGAGADIHPPHRLNFTGSQSISDTLEWSVVLSHFSSPKREIMDERRRIEAKTLVNFMIKRRDFITKGLSLELSVKNLLDEDGRYETQEAMGLLNDLPIEGRRVLLGFEYKIL